VLKLNPQVNQVKESATLAINNQVKKLRAQGKDVCHFGFGQASFEIHDLIQASLKDHAAEKSYLPGQGLDKLRVAIAQFYQKKFNFNYSADDVLIGPGSKELLFQLLYMLEGPLIVPSASWVSYIPQAVLLKKDHYIADTFEKHNYCLQAEDLIKVCQNINAINQDKNIQKILIINSPNNPTGAIYNKNNLEKLAIVCQEYNVIVISDEIYAGINFTGE
jgi:aspartate/methionine/tyrosine aminotransferase